MKFKLLIFSFIAMVIASFSVGCGKSDSVNECTDFPRNDTGAHAVYINGIPPGLNIHDSLQSSQSGLTLTITSLALGRNLIGHQDSIDCNKIAMDSLIIGDGPTDTLKIPTTSLPIPGGFVKIWNVRAGGTGTVTPTGVTTSIKIKRGETNINVGPPGFPITLDLRDLSGKNLELKGSFKRETLP